MTSALIAYLHHISAFILISTIVTEFVLLLNLPTQKTIQHLRTVDALYGISAAVLLLVGFVRVFYFEKGSAYYFQSTAFNSKLVLFAIVGTLSIYSTVQFIQWGRKINHDSYFLPTQEDFKKLRRWKLVELILITPVPLFAALMARGLF